MSETTKRMNQDAAHDLLSDPHFISFATSLAHIVRVTKLRFTLLDRSLRPYDKPEQHPLVKLARRAQASQREASYRTHIAEKLRKEAKTKAQQAWAQLALRVFDAALKHDPIKLREEVAQAGRDRRNLKETQTIKDNVPRSITAS